jgi:polysaccharide export outer membrane protein
VGALVVAVAASLALSASAFAQAPAQTPAQPTDPKAQAAPATPTTQAKPPDPKTQAQPPKPPDPKQAAPAAPTTQAKPPKTTDPKQTAPAGQKPATPAKPGTTPVPPVVPANVPPPPPDYIIGPDDVLQVIFWKDKDMSSEVVVRPDGMISIPLINEVKAEGLTPEQLRQTVIKASLQFFTVEPEVAIVVKTIYSRKVFITGQVAKPGPYALGAPTTVLQLIATAGGLGDFAKQNKITIMRVENGKPVSLKFNYKEVVNGKNLKQNILLKPGDTVIVP